MSNIGTQTNEDIIRDKAHQFFDVLCSQNKIYIHVKDKDWFINKLIDLFAELEANKNE